MSSQLTISGAVSGLDTASIITSLVQVQANQQTLLTTQQTAMQKRADAYTALSTSLSSFGTQAAALAKTSAWSGSTATSTSTSVTATATGTSTGSITFDVTAVATAHALISKFTATSTTEVVANGPLTITRNGMPTTLEVGNGSLSSVVSAINNSKSGLVAAAVRTAPNTYQLQVTSTSTGLDSTFSLDGFTDPSGMGILTAGQDANIHVGSNGDTTYDVTSSTNTFGSLVDGLSFTVGKVENGVTVAAKVDGSAVADKVSALVDAANGILSTISAKSGYDTKTKTGGPFTGQSAVRALQQNILSSASAIDAPGVQLTRTGTLTFDRSAFLKAFSADPTSVAKAFGFTSSFTAPDGASSTTATVSSTLASARPGTYALTVSAQPAQEQWQVSSWQGTTVSLTRGSSTVEYTSSDTESLSDVISALNSRASAAGLGITASDDGTGTLTLTAQSYGVAGAFTAAGGTEGTQLTAGADIAGTIDGQTATGVGNTLSLATGTGGAVGLSVAVNTTADDLANTGGSIGSITYTPGLAQRLTTLVNDATARSTGSLTTAQTSATAEVKRYQTAIDAWDDRLTAYRQTLTQQFTAMETSLARLKSSMSAITGLTSSSSSSGSSSSSSSSS